MRASYKKLWKLLIDKDMNRRDLARISNVSTSTLTKLSKGESVNSEMLVRICAALKCELWDIMELMPENDDEAAWRVETGREGGEGVGKAES